jgi:hypothetical protein
MVNKGEYGWGIFYKCVNMEHWNLPRGEEGE